MSCRLCGFNADHRTADCPDHPRWKAQSDVPSGMLFRVERLEEASRRQSLLLVQLQDRVVGPQGYLGNPVEPLPATPPWPTADELWDVLSFNATATEDTVKITYEDVAHALGMLSAPRVTP